MVLGAMSLFSSECAIYSFSWLTWVKIQSDKFIDDVLIKGGDQENVKWLIKKRYVGGPSCKFIIWYRFSHK